MPRLFVLAALLCALPAHTVNIDWVPVGDPGNAPDDNGYGAVAYTYLVAKREVTNAQYAEFLNAVAATDANQLYNEHMDLMVYPTYRGGISRSGSPGGYTYGAIAGRENMPVNWVSFYDALRFANWLHNGQPVGAQDNTTTEDGTYTMILEDYVSGIVITRNPGASIFLTSEDEWYKAAYFDGTRYYDYPAGTDTQMVCATPGATPNTANCDGIVGDLTDVGSYAGSPSPYGTSDQGGNVWEWSEGSEALPGFLRRDPRGGGFSSSAQGLSRSVRLALLPEEETITVGFRVAMIPEPSTALLVALGLAGLAAAGRPRSPH